jgi:hypothetical protein
MVKITKDFANELNAVFAKYSASVENGLEKAVLQSTIAVESTAKRLVSRGRDAESVDGLPPRVDTGLLRASITHRLKRINGKIVGEAGTNVSYAAELEYGTSKRRWKHPFMAPSAEIEKAGILLRIAKAVKNATA